MKKVFEKYLSSHFANHNPESNPENWHWQSYDEIYGKYLPKNKNVKILDIGCGMGQFLWYLKKKDYQKILGVDISRECVDFCRQKVTKKIRLINDLKKFLTSNKNTFGLIIMNDILEHFSKKEILPILEKVYTALKKEGILFIKTPNAASLTAITLRYQDFTHETSFTEFSLEQILRVAGFQEIYIFGPAESNFLKEKMHRFLMKFIYRFERGGLINPEIFTVDLVAIVKK